MPNKDVYLRVSLFISLLRHTFSLRKLGDDSCNKNNSPIIVFKTDKNEILEVRKSDYYFMKACSPQVIFYLSPCV